MVARPRPANSGLMWFLVLVLPCLADIIIRDVILEDLGDQPRDNGGKAPRPPSDKNNPLSDKEASPPKLTIFPKPVDILVAFIGEQRRWEATWRSQRAFLLHELGPGPGPGLGGGVTPVASSSSATQGVNGSSGVVSWSSMACLSTDDHGIGVEGVKGLRLGRVVRTMTSAWWGAGDDPRAAFFCEGDKGGQSQNGSSGRRSADAYGRVGWVVKRTAEGKAYYVNMRTRRSSWTKPVQLRASFQASMAALAAKKSEDAFSPYSWDRTGAGAAKATPAVTAVTAACFLRRLSACRLQVLYMCRRLGCKALLILRPDLELITPEPVAQMAAPAPHEQGQRNEDVSEAAIHGPFGTLVRALVAASPPQSLGVRQHAPQETDDETTTNTTTTNIASRGAGDIEAVYGRLRCVGAGETPRTSAWPAALCNGRRITGKGKVSGQLGEGGDAQSAVTGTDAALSTTSVLSSAISPLPSDSIAVSSAPTYEAVPCPKGRFTLDDQVILCPAGLAGELLRRHFEPPRQAPPGDLSKGFLGGSQPSQLPEPLVSASAHLSLPLSSGGTLACPATWDWPEGILTTSLLRAGVPVRELTGRQLLTGWVTHPLSTGDPLMILGRTLKKALLHCGQTPDFAVWIKAAADRVEWRKLLGR